MPPLPPTRIFLLSPASCDGARAQILLRDEASFDLAQRLRDGQFVTLGEAFSFLSGLYFRGKLAYALRFGRTTDELSSSFVITAGKGLLPPDVSITISELRSFAAVPICLEEPRYRKPFEKDCVKLARRLGRDYEIVLLGSIATSKYTHILSEVFSDHIRFPIDFVGRGDMSRGGLLLRCVSSGRELEYGKLTATKIRGARPARLNPKGKAAN